MPSVHTVLTHLNRLCWEELSSTDRRSFSNLAVELMSEVADPCEEWALKSQVAALVVEEAVKRPEEEMNQKLEPKVSQDEGEEQKTTASLPRHQCCSTDHSPMDPYYQAKLGAKGNGVSSPSWERKSSSDSSHGLAGRS